MSEINLWVRANLDTFDVDTEALITPHRREEYGLLMEEVALAREAMDNLLARRYQYFREVSDGNL